MKQPKNKEEVISGWANENDINYDAIALTNILRNKTTIGVLPQINYLKSRIETDHRKQNSTSKLSQTKERFYHQSIQMLKAKREKTEGYEQIEAQSKDLQKHLRECIPIKQEGEIIASISPYLTDGQILEKVNRESTFTEIQLNDQKCSKFQQIQEQKNITFFRTMRTQMNNTKSHEFIRHMPSKFQSPKKTQSKLYVKLNTLQMVNDLKKRFRDECIQKMNAKGCLSQSRDILVEKRKKQSVSKMGVDHLDKMSQKFRQTFTKKDIFNKNKRKLSRSDNVQFNDQVIFSNHSIIVNKQNISNPYIHSKIQIIKQPHRYQLLFK